MSLSLSSDILAFMAFIAVVAILIYLDRKKIKREGVMVIRRTQKGKNFIDRTAKKYPRFWNVFFSVGVIISIPIMIILVVMLFGSAVDILKGSTQVGAGIVLPGPTSTPVVLPGLFIIPWWIWIVCIAFLIIPHEFSHGITCRLHNVRIKSVGWILLLFIPGAFVEQDDKQIKKKSSFKKIKIYAAGSFANIFLAVILLIILILIGPILFAPSGVFFTQINNTPAQETNITGAITEINGVQIYNNQNIATELSKYNPGDTIQLKTVGLKESAPVFYSNIADPAGIIVNPSDIKTYEVALAEHPDDRSRAYLGISLANIPTYQFLPGTAIFPLYILLFWMFFFSLAIGAVNLLPAKPLDGGLVYEEIVSKFTKNHKPIVTFTAYLMLLLIIINIIGPYLVNL